MNQRKLIKKGIILCLVYSLIFFISFLNTSAQEINWVKVANVNNEYEFIDINSIKYNNVGILLVKAKYSETTPNYQKDINSQTYLMAIDCNNRLYSNLPIDSEINKVKEWKRPTNNKLIKTSIINICSY